MTTTHSPSSAQSVMQVDIAALREHASKGWGTDCLIPKSVVALIVSELETRRAAASAQATVRPTPISISTEKICEVAKKYNLGNPRLDALRGFVNEIIIVNGAEYAKSE